MKLYLKSIEQYIHDDDEDNLFIGDKNVTDLDSQFMAQLTENERDAIWYIWKYDVWGDPEYDFTKSK